MAKQFSIADILTPAEFKRAQELYRQYAGSGQFATKLVEELIEPNMARIDQALGQENNARYLAYVVEHVLSQTPQ